jgi:hypothetical protein
MTEDFIIKKLASWLDDRKYPFQLSTVFIYKWESDYWAMTASGETREFEIKVSRSDYFADAKKDKHNGNEGANYFYFVTPKDLIRKEEVPGKYGLIHIHEDGFAEVVKKPQRLNGNTFEKWKMLAVKMYWRYRSLWREKHFQKEITYEQYIEGFNIKVDEFEELLNSEPDDKSSVATDVDSTTTDG